MNLLDSLACSASQFHHTSPEKTSKIADTSPTRNWTLNLQDLALHQRREQDWRKNETKGPFQTDRNQARIWEMHS
ncbi:MAG: hypothetical protein J6A23_04300 [Thermoguttaceae bacterium]|nr:hypothetical protein [Thermoguttaceae bacterium]MBP3694215.1 hypothetical protein [Thermoguttaceae bacterium]